MNKYQALYEFYNSFGIPAYEENSVPEDAELPYITYEILTADLDMDNVAISCQIYFKSNSLMKINAITEKLYNALSGGLKLKCDTGYIVLYRGRPFAQNRPSGDKTVKAKYINISADYITR